MSLLMTFVVAVKRPAAQRDADGADRARHDHRRRRRDRDGGDRHRRARVDREPDPQRGHERRHGQRRLRRLRPGAPGQRRDDDADGRRTPTRSRSEVPGIRYMSPALNTRVADRRRDRELEHAGSGRQRRSPADPLVADAVRQLLHRAGRATAAKVAVLGSVVARSAVRRRRGSDRRDDPHQEPAVPGRRRADEQGPGRDGPGSGRHGRSCRTRPCRRSCSASQHVNGITSRRPTACRSTQVSSGIDDLLRARHRIAAGRRRRLLRPHAGGDGVDADVDHRRR